MKRVYIDEKSGRCELDFELAAILLKENEWLGSAKAFEEVLNSGDILLRVTREELDAIDYAFDLVENEGRADDTDRDIMAALFEILKELSK